MNFKYISVPELKICLRPIKVTMYLFVSFLLEKVKKHTKYSEECKTHEGNEFVLDYDKKGVIIGIEIFDWKVGKGPPKNKQKLC